MYLYTYALEKAHLAEVSLSVRGLLCQLATSERETTRSKSLVNCYFSHTWLHHFIAPPHGKPSRA